MSRMELIKEGTSIEDILKLGEVVEIVEERLWVVQNIGKKGCDEIQFMTFGSSLMDGSNLTLDPMFLIHGYSGTLREGRHTYFPDDGYVFYMDSRLMRIALDYCEKYFDMD
jgi:hypothetical protein